MVNTVRLTSALRLTPDLQNATICSQKLKQKCYQSDSPLFPLSRISSEISGKTQIKCSWGQLRPPEADGIFLYCSEAELVSFPLENIGMHPKKQCQPCHKQNHCHWRDDLSNRTKDLLFKHHWLLEGVKIFLLGNSLTQTIWPAEKGYSPKRWNIWSTKGAT